VKVRGNAQHVFEKYQQLARDAGSAGDRVLAENYLQHAEHYFRLLRALQPTRPASEIIGRDQFASGYDIDFEDETGQAQSIAADEAAAAAAAAGETAGEAREAREAREDGEARDQNRPRDRDRGDWQARDDRPRDRNRAEWQPREGRDRDRNRDRPRDERPREEQPREDRPRAEGEGRPPRDERPRAEGEGRRERFDRQDRERDRDRGDRPARDPLAVVQPQGDPAPEERGPMLRDSEGGASHAPAFLQAAAPRPTPAADTADEKPAKPRRRRAPRSFEGDAAPAPAESAED
jgi:hypothetical protein